MNSYIYTVTKRRLQIGKGGGQYQQNVSGRYSACIMSVCLSLQVKVSNACALLRHV